jgi:hypothetical protein
MSFGTLFGQTGRELGGAGVHIDEEVDALH